MGNPAPVKPHIQVPPKLQEQGHKTMQAWQTTAEVAAFWIAVVGALLVLWLVRKFCRG